MDSEDEDEIVLLGFPDETVFRPGRNDVWVEMYACRPLPGYGAYVWHGLNGKMTIMIERAAELSESVIGDVVYRNDNVEGLLQASALIHAFIKGELH